MCTLMCLWVRDVHAHMHVCEQEHGIRYAHECTSQRISWCQVSFSKHNPSAFETESLAGTSAGRSKLTVLPELRSQMCAITVRWCF